MNRDNCYAKEFTQVYISALQTLLERERPSLLERQIHPCAPSQQWWPGPPFNYLVHLHFGKS